MVFPTVLLLPLSPQRLKSGLLPNYSFKRAAVTGGGTIMRYAAAAA